MELPPVGRFKQLLKLRVRGIFPRTPSFLFFAPPGSTNEHMGEGIRKFRFSRRVGGQEEHHAFCITAFRCLGIPGSGVFVDMFQVHCISQYVRHSASRKLTELVVPGAPIKSGYAATNVRCQLRCRRLGFASGSPYVLRCCFEFLPETLRSVLGASFLCYPPSVQRCPQP